MSKLQACIVGHSFVRRLGENCGGTRHTAPDPAMAAKKLEVDRQFRKVHVFGHNGYTVTQIRQDIFRAGKLRPDVVIINCGSNDLCQVDCDVSKVASGIVAYAELLRVSYDVRQVMLVQGIRRKRCRDLTEDEFSKRVHAFNELLREKTHNNPGIDYVTLKGFWRDTEGNDLRVSSWSDDGIHP